MTYASFESWVCFNCWQHQTQESSKLKPHQGKIYSVWIGLYKDHRRLQTTAISLGLVGSRELQKWNEMRCDVCSFQSCAVCLTETWFNLIQLDSTDSTKALNDMSIHWRRSTGMVLILSSWGEALCGSGGAGIWRVWIQDSCSERHGANWCKVLRASCSPAYRLELNTRKVW